MSLFQSNLRKQNQKFAENSEFCENYLLLFKIIHFTPYSEARLSFSQTRGRGERDSEAVARPISGPFERTATWELLTGVDGRRRGFDDILKFWLNSGKIRRIPAKLF